MSLGSAARLNRCGEFTKQSRTERTFHSPFYSSSLPQTSEGSPEEPHLEEGLLLLQVLADEGEDMVGLGLGTQLVVAPAPVLVAPVLLLQTLQHAAHLRGHTARESSRVTWNSCYKSRQQYGNRLTGLYIRLRIYSEKKCFEAYCLI